MMTSSYAFNSEKWQFETTSAILQFVWTSIGFVLLKEDTTILEWKLLNICHIQRSLIIHRRALIMKSNLGYPERLHVTWNSEWALSSLWCYILLSMQSLIGFFRQIVDIDIFWVSLTESVYLIQNDKDFPLKFLIKCGNYHSLSSVCWKWKTPHMDEPESENP